MRRLPGSLLFFFNDTATTEIYTLSLHDALPIWPCWGPMYGPQAVSEQALTEQILDRLPDRSVFIDRKSTRLNSSHLVISYAVFCLKKKKKTESPSRSNTGQPPRSATAVRSHRTD